MHELVVSIRATCYLWDFGSQSLAYGSSARVNASERGVSSLSSRRTLQCVRARDIFPLKWNLSKHLSGFKLQSAGSSVQSRVQGAT